MKPPIALVITEKAVQIVMFPFKHEKDLLVNAIMLDPIDIMTRPDGDGIVCVNQRLLALLAILTCPDEDLVMDEMTLGGDIGVKKVSIEDCVEESGREVFSTTFPWCLFSLFKSFCLLHRRY